MTTQDTRGVVTPPTTVGQKAKKTGRRIGIATLIGLVSGIIIIALMLAVILPSRNGGGQQSTTNRTDSNPPAAAAGGGGQPAVNQPAPPAAPALVLPKESATDSPQTIVTNKYTILQRAYESQDPTLARQYLDHFYASATNWTNRVDLVQTPEYQWIKAHPGQTPPGFAIPTGVTQFQKDAPGLQDLAYKVSGRLVHAYLEWNPDTSEWLILNVIPQ
ncbi:MAG TPA: hypothetical protein VLF67_05400 [Candidatus Saccharimonas sp.]|nr:hypothetical protein [Candidatus Saccharimonas sp.]